MRSPIIKRITALLLLGTMAFSLTACGSDTPADVPDPAESVSETPAETTPPPPADLVIGEGGKSEYVIVRSEDATTMEAENTLLLRSRINEEYGVSIKPVSDLETANFTQRQEKEIIIGSTTSEGTLYTLDRDAMGKHGYVIRVIGEKVLIAASSNAGYSAAIEDFVTNLLKKDGDTITLAAGTDLFVDHDTVAATLPAQFDVEDMEGLVGICYTTWFNPIIDGNGKNDPPNITEVLAGERNWGGDTAFHYWAEPALGYYRSDDKEVIRTHMAQLSEAGVDFIIVDNTNANTWWKNAGSPGSSKSYWTTMITEPTIALLDTIVEMRKEGLKTPYVVMWCAQDENWSVVNAIMEEFYSKEAYTECWVYWGGKPFFLISNGAGEKRDDIVYRQMWGLQSRLSESEWCFLKVPAMISYDANKNPEQVGVCVAAQQTYMSLPTATGRNGGKTFYNNWKIAFMARPKFVTLTWWNEWAAQKFTDDNGNVLFVDNYNQEYSRDIEPMKGGHGDQYYQWMKQYIAAYKAGEECPKLYEGAE